MGIVKREYGHELKPETIDITCPKCQSVLRVNFRDIDHEWKDHGNYVLLIINCSVCRERILCEKLLPSKWARELKEILYHDLDDEF
jgi:hypothetical protein